MGCFKNTTSCGMKLFFKFITTVFMVFYLVILFALTASAATYVVEEGDSLDWISRHFSVSVKSIQNANGLKNDLIHPGQKLLITTGTKTTSNTSGKSATTKTSGSTTTYVVKKGDSLDWISRHFSVSVKSIQNANGLKNDLIHPGQKLLITTGTKTTSKPNYRSVTAQAPQSSLSSRGSTDEAGDNILSIATSLMGSPYSYGSSGPNSFDCSGFTSYVFNKVGINMPHNAAAQASLGTHVKETDLQPNDLVFFGYYGSQGINHVGIYVGGGKFIHASTNEGVRYSSLNDAYYSSNYRGARRIQ